MKSSEVLKVIPIAQPVNKVLCLEIEFSCSSCDGSGVVRMTDIQWDEMKAKPMTDYVCPKCTGDDTRTE